VGSAEYQLCACPGVCGLVKVCDEERESYGNRDILEWVANAAGEHLLIRSLPTVGPQSYDPPYAVCVCVCVYVCVCVWPCGQHTPAPTGHYCGRLSREEDLLTV
jgi:hypothetical protein